MARCRSCVPITRRTPISKRKLSSMSRHSGSLDWRPSSGYFIDLLVHKHAQDRHRAIDRDIPVEPARLLKTGCGHVCRSVRAPMSR